MNQKTAQVEIDVIEIEGEETVPLSTEQLDFVGGGECMLNGV